MDDQELRKLLLKLIERIEGNDRADKIIERLDIIKRLERIERTITNIDERLKKVEGVAHEQITEAEILKRYHETKKQLPFRVPDEPYCLPGLHPRTISRLPFRPEDVKLC